MASNHDAIWAGAEPLLFMQRMADEAVRLVPAAEGVGIALLASDQVLHYVTVAGQMLGYKGLRLSVADSLHGIALRTGQIQSCDDATSDPRVDHEVATMIGIKSMIAVPVMGNGTPLGAFTVTSSSAFGFTGGDMELLESLVGFISATVSALADGMAVEPSGDGSGIPVTIAGTGHGSTIARFIAQVMAPAVTINGDTFHQVSQVIDQRAFRTVVQPIVNMIDGHTVGVEALTRFDRPSPPPADWFLAADQVGLGAELEHSAAVSALEVLEHLPANVYLSFNTGPALVFGRSLERLLGGCDLSRVVIELTEHVVVDDYEQLSATLAPIRAAGARLAIDDAGAGFSSLSHILKLAPDLIKIDRSLVESIKHRHQPTDPCLGPCQPRNRDRFDRHRRGRSDRSRSSNPGVPRDHIGPGIPLRVSGIRLRRPATGHATDGRAGQPAAGWPTCARTGDPHRSCRADGGAEVVTGADGLTPTDRTTEPSTGTQDRVHRSGSLPRGSARLRPHDHRGEPAAWRIPAPQGQSWRVAGRRRPRLLDVPGTRRSAATDGRHTLRR
jgi:EAL domain-containing protein (putative c-di-GMP-specific phosphodiesterase class I)/putative methionine-R-sulfoxide reductase with GAF domain